MKTALYLTQYRHFHSDQHENTTYLMVSTNVRVQAPQGLVGMCFLLQVVWKATKRVGVGIAVIKRGFLTKTYIVARYSPPGNYQGQFKQQVGNSVFALK